MNKTQTGWFQFDYAGKARYGLVIGPDTRPNTNNVVCCTDKGVRTYNVNKMENVIDETSIYVLRDDKTFRTPGSTDCEVF